MATDENSRPSDPSMPSRESAAQALALAEQAQAAVGAISPGRWYQPTLAAFLVGIFLTNLLPDPFDFTAVIVLFVGMMTFVVLQVRKMGVMHRATPKTGRQMAVGALLGITVYVTALVVEHQADMPWVWVPAALLVGGGILGLERHSRTKGIPA
ncbi:hypothetical protein ABZ442_19825 [Streptomyces triculaminicus]|uniref:hypothetical protein n=1 Tax=Streptomyces triculaminicus TaxID=2816232 RepID=UPI00341076BF